MSVTFFLRFALLTVLTSRALLSEVTHADSSHLAYVPACSPQTGSIRHHHPEVAVWDNVVPKSSLQALHDAASRSGLGHKVFTRPVANEHDHANLSVIERALDAILTEMDNDNSASAVGNDAQASTASRQRPKQYVEYWARQQWKSIEAHADVDEKLAVAQDAAGDGAYRYPVHGHVLYLKVGTEVLGPTCVFPNHRTGGELLRPIEEEIKTGNQVELITVPAVPGRVLRFDGSALHAVPRPADLWLLTFEEGNSQHAPEDVWGRSVILFNVWHEEPPLDVPLDVRGDGESSALLGTLGKHCNPRSDWIPSFELGAARHADEQGTDHRGTDLLQKEEEEVKMALSAKIWLLGNIRRRDHLMRNVRLAAPNSLRQALEEPQEVRRVMLKHS